MEVLKKTRGSVWWVHFDPTEGSEIQKSRPAIIVSNNISNRYLDRFQVVPVTSNIEKLYPGEAHVQIKTQACKAMADQIRTVSKTRFGKKVCTLSSTDMADVDRVLRIQLGLY